MFSQSTETAQGCWTQLGMAIRMAMEVGAHRRRTLKAPTVEDESWKRVFCADVDRPTECDDEYWCSPDPTLAFKQPANKPSTVAFFNTYLKLTDIFAHAMRVIYSVKKPAPESGQSASAINQKIIMDLDSAMNSWMDSVPDHRGIMRADFGMSDIADNSPKAYLSIIRELLLSLASAGDLPFKDEAARLHSFTTGTKRPRECDAIPKAQSGERPEDKAQRKMAGSQRVSLSPDHTPSPPSTQTLNYELPMYATELGRLPVYGQFNFSESCSESNKRLRREPPSPIRARAFSMPSHGEINAGSPFFSEMSSFTTQFGKPQCVPSDWDPHFSSRVSPVATPCYLDPGIHDNGASFTDNDFFAMWSTSATGFEIDGTEYSLNEWGTYITSVDQLAHTPDTSGNAWFQ
ncbi:hypothetical protein H0H81_008407 [Sphagnurus paluster]|uniref:Uncharacterized protein n=1 Tax=Sphagnurus paluster TaxID=117069 RepID=A0A9P7FQI1_9AGAR|nr:hypothetical protein H0H81_008407 [Sphagnurus paluster]